MAIKILEISNVNIHHKDLQKQPPKGAFKNDVTVVRGRGYTKVVTKRDIGGRG